MSEQTAQGPDHIMQFFSYAHLPERLQNVSKPFGEMAHNIVETLPRNPERTVALRKLLEAKDAAVRALLAAPVLILCLFLGGCAASHYNVGFNPITGEATIGVSVDGSVTANATLPTKAIDPCGRAITRAVDPCADGRAILPAYRAIDRAVPLYGRGLGPWTERARGLQDVRTVAVRTKAIHNDLKRELHNAALARDYTHERSMASCVKGFFGFHRKLCPLDQSLALTTTPAEFVPYEVPPDPAAGPTAAQNPVQPNADGSFEIKGDTQTNRELQKRVAKLELRVDAIDNGLVELKKGLDENFAKVLAKIEEKKQ